MKIWTGFGSEHSANLVMIGRFEDATKAEQAEQLFTRINEYVADEVDEGRIDFERDFDSTFSDSALDLMRELGMYSLAPSDIEQFGYEHSVNRDDNEIVITTEETDVQGFLKVLLDKGAKVEVYSAHVHKGEYGRGKSSG